MILIILINIIKCLLLTIIVELIIAALLNVRNKGDILNIILVNIMTNPLLNGISIYLNYGYSSNVKNNFVIIYEIVNVFFEGFIYSKVLKKCKLNPYLLSFILNWISYLLSLLF